MLLCQTHIQTLECVESTHSIHSFRLEIAIAPPSLFLCLWIQEHKAASSSEEKFNRQKWVGHWDNQRPWACPGYFQIYTMQIGPNIGLLSSSISQSITWTMQDTGI